LAEAEGIKLIASGESPLFDELPKLAELGCEGTIIGKAIYEGRISLKQLENYIIGNNKLKHDNLLFEIHYRPFSTRCFEDYEKVD
jgi:hypothetical protein